MLRCSLQDWHQFNGNPSLGICALKDIIQAAHPHSPLSLTLSDIKLRPLLSDFMAAHQRPGVMQRLL